MQHVLEMWESEGRSMIDQYFSMVGQWTSETGTLNRIFTLWQFRDMQHRNEAREKLLQHPGFSEYLARCRAMYVEQEAHFLSPTTLSPLQ
jgi:hypothetical protein